MPSKYRVETKAGNKYEIELADGDDIDSAVAEIEASEAVAPAPATTKAVAPVAAVRPAATSTPDEDATYDMMTGVQTGYKSTTPAGPEIDARKEPWIQKEVARLAEINPGKTPETLRALAQSRYVADPKPAAPVDRVQQYIDKGAAPINALGSANFDQKLEGKFERKYKQRKADERGNRVNADYNPNTEADEAAKQDAEYKQQRVDAGERGRAEQLGSVGRGLAKGALQTAGFAAGAVGFAGDLVGNDGVKKWGIDAYNSMMHSVGNIPGKEFTELESREDVADYLANTVSYGAFQAAQAILTGGVGGVAGKQIGKEAVGQIVALAAQNVTTELGMIYGDAQEEAARTGKPPPSLAQVAAGAVLAASIDTFADKVGMDSVTRLGFKGNALSRLAKSIGMQAGVQGGTEAAQKVPEEWGAGKDPFREGIGKDYINEAAAGAIMGGGPGVAGAVRRNSPENEIASEIDRAVQETSFGDVDAQVRSSMSPYQDTGTVSFTRPDSPTSQAGLVPIVVPVMAGNNQGGENDGLLGDTPGVVGGRGGSEGGNGIGGLAGSGRITDGIRGGNSTGAEINSPNNGAPELLGNGSGTPAANVGLPRVAERATDNELLERVNAALPQAEQKAEPSTVMNGRGGKGYATQQDAQVAQQVGMKREPDMDWRIEPADGGRFRVAAYAKEKADSDWSEFSPESGTLNVPRADMPQIKSEHRGALTNFLNARGISHQQEEVDAGTLKPTQREFSQTKVQQARDYVGGERSILVSADNHVLDGHHQWLAKKDSGQAVKVIRLNAPIKSLMVAAKEFPSVQSSEGATTATEDANAGRDIAGAGATLDQAPGPADALARPDIQAGSGEGNVADPRDESIRATGAATDGSIASDANNARTAAAAPVQVIERARAVVASENGAKIRQSIKPLTESQALASAIAARAGRTFTVVESTDGKPVPNGMVIDDKHVIVAANADDAPLFVTMHEVYHGIPEAKRAPLNKALLDLFNEDKRSDFAKEFGYDAADRQLLDEEIPAFMAQAVSRRKDFWVELRRKMGDADFAAVAKQIIAGLDAMIQSAKAAYGSSFEKKYIKDVEAARKLLTTAYADAMAGKPIEDAKGADWQKSVQRKDELLAANMPAPDVKKSGRAVDEIPPAFYRKIKVPLEVYIAEEDAYETVEVPANQALASVREDIENYKALIQCMKA